MLDILSCVKCIYYASIIGHGLYVSSNDKVQEEAKLACPVSSGVSAELKSVIKEKNAGLHGSEQG